VGTQKRFARPSADKGVGRGPTVLLKVNDACKGLLRTIGVLGMVELSDAQVPFPRDLPRLSPEARSSARYLLDAHEELSDISDENRRRFETLTKVLKGAIEAEGKAADKGPEKRGG
jgi:hypothetical protein